MDLVFGRSVASTDAWVGGLHGALLAIPGGLATHLIVNRGLLFPRRYLVPLDRLEHQDNDGLYLDISIREVISLERHRASERDSSTVALTARSRLGTVDGAELPLHGLRICAETRALTQFVVASRRGPGRRKVLVPVQNVAGLDSKRLESDADRVLLDGLPTFRLPEDLEADVWEALYEGEQIPLVDLGGVRLHVEDGIATFEGNVRTASVSTEAERLARSVDGVAGVADRLVNDRDIELAFASHIGREAPHLSGAITVVAHLGAVQLKGHVPSPEERAATLKGVRSINGVRRLEDLMEEQPPVAESEPALAAEGAA